MARAVTISRHAADDRRGPAKSSPFRSKSDDTRLIGALEMVRKRHEELRGLEEILAATTDRRTRLVVQARIRATRNNLQSWEDYLDDEAPREPRAVITPRSAS